jgi:hypothetical protein
MELVYIAVPRLKDQHMSYFESIAVGEVARRYLWVERRAWQKGFATVLVPKIGEVEKTTVFSAFWALLGKR